MREEEGERKWESTNDLMVCSLFFLFCGAQQYSFCSLHPHLLLVEPLSSRGREGERRGEREKGGEKEGEWTDGGA